MFKALGMLILNDHTLPIEVVVKFPSAIYKLTGI